MFSFGVATGQLTLKENNENLIRHKTPLWTDHLQFRSVSFDLFSPKEGQDNKDEQREGENDLLDKHTLVKVNLIQFTLVKNKHWLETNIG